MRKSLWSWLASFCALFSWIKTKVSAAFAPRKRKRQRPIRRRHRRLMIERLEPRLMMSASAWIGPSSGGSWGDSANWDHGIPGASDTAYVSGLSAGATIRLDGIQAVNKLQIAANNVQSNLIAPGSGGHLEIGAGGITTSGNQSKGISADIVLTAAQDWNIANVNGLSVSGVISGGVASGTALSKLGAQLLTFSGNNSYTGVTDVTAGTLRAGHTNALGASGAGNETIVDSGGTLSFGASNIPEAISVAGALSTFTASSLAGPLTLAPAPPVALIGVYTQSGTLTLLGQVTGWGGINKLGLGNLVLGNSANDYNGDTVVNSAAANTGILLGDDNVIPNGPGKGDVIVNKGFFDLGGHDETINGLFSTLTTGIVTNSGLGAWTLTVGANDATSSFAGKITNSTNRPLELTKTGAGTLTITNPNNNYQGDTTVEAGTLKLGAASVIPNGPGKGNLVVSSAGSLDLNGFSETINGLSGSGAVSNSSAASATVHIASGSTVAPGATSTPGILTTTNISFDTSSTSFFDVQVNGDIAGISHDQLNVIGSVDLGTATTLNVSAIPAPPAGDAIIIQNDGDDPIVGTFGGKPEGTLFTVGDHLFMITYVGGDGNDVALIRALIDVDVDSNNDGVIDPDNNSAIGKDDPIEENVPGKLVDIGGLVRVELNTTISGSTDDWRAHLGLASGSDPQNTIRVWSTPEKTIELDVDGAGTTWEIAEVPEAVWVEGIEAGSAILELEVQQQNAENPNEYTIKDSDKVKLTVKDLKDIDLDVTDNGAIGNAGDGVASYLPGYRGETQVLTSSATQHMNVIVTGLEPEAVVFFKLEATSRLAGIASNKNSDAGTYPSTSNDDDFVLDGANAQGVSQVTADANGRAVVGIVTSDFGGRTTVVVRDVNGEIIATLSVPLDTDGDTLPDVWEALYGGLKNGSVDDDRNEGAGGVPGAIGGGFGDRLPAFDEYRGFFVSNVYMRTSPLVKQVFVFAPDRDPFLAADNNDDGFQRNPANGPIMGIGAAAPNTDVEILILNDSEFTNVGDEYNGQNGSAKGDVNFNSPAPYDGVRQKRVWITTDLSPLSVWTGYGASVRIEDGSFGPNSRVELTVGGATRAAAWVYLAAIRSGAAFVDGDGTADIGPGTNDYIFGQRTVDEFSVPAGFPPVDQTYQGGNGGTAYRAFWFRTQDNVYWWDADQSGFYSRGDALWIEGNNNGTFESEHDQVIARNLDEPVSAGTEGQQLTDDSEFRYVDSVNDPAGYQSGDDIFSVHFNVELYTQLRDQVIAHEGLGHPISMVHVSSDEDFMVSEIVITMAGVYKTDPARYFDPPQDATAANQNLIRLR